MAAPTTVRETIEWRFHNPTPYEPILLRVRGRVCMGYYSSSMSSHEYGGHSAWIADGRPVRLGEVDAWAYLPKGPP